MNVEALRYFLFPQTILSERDFRFLSHILPALSLLQALRAPVLPKWGRHTFAAWPAITDHELLNAVQASYRAYQNYAALHGEESGLAAISHEAAAGDYAESRFRIQGMLRGREASATADATTMLVEAAVFLEMARDLDEREIELENGIAEVDHLEHEFREILGISSEEELKDVIETVTPPLVSAGGPAFRLARRMAFWLRLFHARQAADLPILVTTSVEVLEEAVESISREFAQQHREFNILQGEECDIPVPASSELRDSPGPKDSNAVSGSFFTFSQALADFLEGPRDASAREKLTAAWASLMKEVSAGGESAPPASQKLRKLSWALLEGAAVGDLWKSMDHNGVGTLAAILSPRSAPLFFLIVH